jgi:carbamoylphosphate synthase small subunit
MKEKVKAKLILGDGSVFQGYSFAKEKEVSDEVVLIQE